MERKTPKQGDFFKVLFDSLCCIIYADRKVSNSERQALYKLIERTKIPLEHEEIDKRIEAHILKIEKYGLDLAVRETCEALAQFRGRGKENVLQKCLDYIARADGVISEDEKKLCEVFRAALGTEKINLSTSLPARSGQIKLNRYSAQKNIVKTKQKSDEVKQPRKMEKNQRFFSIEVKCPLCGKKFHDLPRTNLQEALRGVRCPDCCKMVIPREIEEDSYELKKVTEVNNVKDSLITDADGKFMFCPYCGNKIVTFLKTCTRCGKPLKGTVEERERQKRYLALLEQQKIIMQKLKVCDVLGSKSIFVKKHDRKFVSQTYAEQKELKKDMESWYKESFPMRFFLVKNSVLIAISLIFISITFGLIFEKTGLTILSGFMWVIFFFSIFYLTKYLKHR